MNPQLKGSIIHSSEPVNIKIWERISSTDSVFSSNSIRDTEVMKSILEELWQYKADPELVIAWWTHILGDKDIVSTSKIDQHLVIFFIKQCLNRDRGRRGTIQRFFTLYFLRSRNKNMSCGNPDKGAGVFASYLYCS